MTESIYHYVVDLPTGCKEAVVVCPDGYTVYTNSNLSREEAIKAYEHAMKHVRNNDFDLNDNADTAELRAHES